MKKMSLWVGLVAGMVCNESSLFAAQSSLVCIEGLSFVRQSHFESGCRFRSESFFSTLELNADSIHGGTINFKVDGTFEISNLHCDNPRGRYVVHHLPLPISRGVWDIFEDGEALGKVSFKTIFPCRIRGGGPVLQ